VATDTARTIKKSYCGVQRPGKENKQVQFKMFLNTVNDEAEVMSIYCITVTYGRTEININVRSRIHYKCANMF